MIHNAIQTHCKALCGISAHHRAHRCPTASKNDVSREESSLVAVDFRSSTPACPDDPPAVSVSQRMGTIYPGAPGATGRQTRARSLAEHATSNTTEEANDRCRTPDGGTAEDEHFDHNRTTPATRQAPAWALFTFQGLSCQLRRVAHGRFMEARPPRPVSVLAMRATRQQAVQSSHRRKGTLCRAGCLRGAAREDWRNHDTHSRMRRARGQPKSRRMDDGDRDAGAHEGEPKQGVLNLPRFH